MRLQIGRRARPRGATVRRRRAPQRRRWLSTRCIKLLGLGIVVLGLAVGALQATRHIELPVRQVTVQGQFRYLDAQSVEQAIVPLLQDGLLAVSLEELRRTLEALPWVEQARIKRKWPDELAVFVVEQVPIASWGEDRLISKRGQAFSPAGVAIEEKLPRLAGPAGTELEVMQRYVELQGVLGTRGLEVQTLSMSARGSWNLTLSNQVELVFGRRKLTEKLQRFLAVYDRKLNEYLPQAERVDLRYQNGLAVRWRHQPASSLVSGDAGA